MGPGEKRGRRQCTSRGWIYSWELCEVGCIFFYIPFVDLRPSSRGSLKRGCRICDEMVLSARSRTCSVLWFSVAGTVKGRDSYLAFLLFSCTVFVNCILKNGPAARLASPFFFFFLSNTYRRRRQRSAPSPSILLSFPSFASDARYTRRFGKRERYYSLPPPPATTPDVPCHAFDPGHTVCTTGKQGWTDLTARTLSTW